MSGQAVAGVFASLLEIFTLAVFDDQENSALLYFLLTEVLLGGILVAVITLGRLPFYIYHTNLNRSIATPSERHAKGSLFKETFLVFKKTLPFGLSVAFVFFITLTVFPNYIDSIPAPRNFGGKYWYPVTCFLLFNVCDLLGRVCAGVFKRPSSMYGIIGLCIARVGFIPLYLFSNFQPRRNGLDVWFYSGWWPLAFTTFLALTNGYVGSLCMMYGPNTVSDPALQEQAGTVLAFFLSLGLSLGSAFSFAFIKIP